MTSFDLKKFFLKGEIFNFQIHSLLWKDHDETYASVASLEAIRMLLAFACHKSFKLYQKYVKSASLNGYIHEEVYVDKSPSFENPQYKDHMFKLTKHIEFKHHFIRNHQIPDIFTKPLDREINSNILK